MIKLEILKHNEVVRDYAEQSENSLLILMLIL